VHAPSGGGAHAPLPSCCGGDVTFSRAPAFNPAMTTIAEPAPIARRDPAVIAAIAVTTLLWASAFVAIRDVRAHYTAGPLALGRLVVGAIALSALMVVSRAGLPRRRDWPAIVACGVLWFGGYNVALNAGERLIDAGTAAMLVNVAPIMIAVAAAAVL